MPDMNDALQKGLLGLSSGPSEPSDAPKGDEDMEILYDEFKDAGDAKTALAALRQLVRGLK